MTAFDDLVDAAVARADCGTAAAVKRGRDPRWPYVPVIRHGRHSSQIRGLAYATRQEALDAAEEHLERARELLARKLRDPRHRALRESYGLPRELTQPRGARP